MTMQKPVQSQIAATMIARLLKGVLLESQACGSKPGTTSINAAFTKPVWGSPGGRKSYMNRQITPAATNEIAMGRKIAALTRLSWEARSASTAMARPSVTVAEVKTTTQMTLLRSAVSMVG